MIVRWLTVSLAIPVAMLVVFVGLGGCIEVHEILGSARPAAGDGADMDNANGAMDDDSVDDGDAASDDGAGSGEDMSADDSANDDGATDDAADEMMEPSDVGPDKPVEEEMDSADMNGDTSGDMDSNGADSAGDMQEETGVPPLPDDAVLSTSDTGLQTYDFSVGDGEMPSLTSRVRVNYTGYLEDGTVFDSGEDTEFPLTGVIDGFAEGIAGMQVGGRRRMIIPPEIGYGDAGRPSSGIGPDDNLIFDVDLLEIVEP